MKLLHINASPRGDDSESLALAERFISDLSRDRDLEIDRIDLFHDDLPAFGPTATAAKMALFSGREQSEAEIAEWAAIRAVFDRFAAAEVYVFNVPMWNNGLPYILKQYIDLVTQPGWSFGFDPERGYSGLLRGKRAVVVQASGVWREGVGPSFGSDFSTPYLEDWLRFIGVAEVDHLRIQPTVLNADVSATREHAQTEAKELAMSM